MTMILDSLSLGSTKTWMDSTRASYRPPSWPPPREWVVSEDQDGNPISEWGHSKWDLTLWAGVPFILNFQEKYRYKRKNRQHPSPMDAQNADLLRLIMTWKIWGSTQGLGVSSIRTAFILLRKVVSFCSTNGILVSELNSRPDLVEKIPSLVSKSLYRTLILELHRLFEARQSVGFFIVDAESLAKLSYLTQPKEVNQTPYIPPRIWLYQINRLKACIEDFNKNKENIELCFNFCCEVYNRNIECFGEFPLVPIYQPFNAARNSGEQAKNGCKFYGQFAGIAEEYEIKGLIEEWVSVPARGLSITCLDTYMNLVEYACLAYIANFTLQRCEEVGSLKEDCLIWEHDDKLGRIPIICGPTSKTVKDSDARWPTSPAVQIAVTAAQSIARMRKLYPAYLKSDDDIDETSYLRSSYAPPWGGKLCNRHSPRKKMLSYSTVVDTYDKLFDINELRINSEDIKIARMLTPTITDNSSFALGSTWKLAWHQLRRTGAVNMFCSGIISDSSMQQLLKHSSRFMPLYYGAGYSKLLLNEEVAKIVISTMYESIARNLEIATSDRFASPFGKSKKELMLADLISEKDAKSLNQAAKNGTINVRETRVGFCLSREPCEYGGIESISRCAGGDGRAPCTKALFDREKRKSIETQLQRIRIESEALDPDSPRYKAMILEAAGLEKILNVFK